MIKVKKLSYYQSVAEFMGYTSPQKMGNIKYYGVYRDENNDLWVSFNFIKRLSYQGEGKGAFYGFLYKDGTHGWELVKTANRMTKWKVANICNKWIYDLRGEEFVPPVRTRKIKPERREALRQRALQRFSHIKRDTDIQCPICDHEFHVEKIDTNNLIDCPSCKNSFLL